MSRELFERLHPVPKNVVWLPSNEMYWTFTEFGETDIAAMKEHNALWQGFQSGHAAGLEQQAKRITELEARLEIGTGPYDGIAARDETIRLLEAQLQSHSANTVGGPTPVMDAAPAWQAMDTAPTDGREFLIRYPLQGNVKQLACWNNIHKYWQSKGEPITPMQQKCEWHPLP